MNRFRDMTDESVQAARPHIIGRRLGYRVDGSALAHADRVSLAGPLRFTTIGGTPEIAEIYPRLFISSSI